MNQETTTYLPRQRDRRLAFADLLTTLARALDRRDDIGWMRGALEDTLRRVVRLRSVRIRDYRSRWANRLDGPPGAESIALEILGPEPNMGGVLEATFDPGAGLGEWDFQMLGIGAHVSALVLEIERCRSQLARAGLLHGSRMPRDGAAPLIGSTPVMQALRSAIERVSATDFTVLIEGESGVGKELVARQIHEISRRRNGPFVAVNCAAIVETLLEAELFGIEDRTATGVRGRRGKFEAAEGGTLFLDEVSDLSPSAQAKLLRAIQEMSVERVGGNGAHRVDTRIIAATNRPLATLVAQRTFRPDLFYRLSGVDLRVPALSERRDDIIELAAYFLARHRAMRHLRLSPEAAEALAAYDWPGNVRELERLIERVVALAESDVIGLEDLPPSVGGSHVAALSVALRRSETLRAWARRYARIMLARCGGNKRETARVLGISYHTLQAYLRAPIDAPEVDGAGAAPDGRAPAPDATDEGVLGAGEAGEETEDDNVGASSRA